MIHNRKSTPSTSTPFFAPWAPLALRLMVGYGFIAHGYAKLSRGTAAFGSILDAMSVPAPYLSGEIDDPRRVGRRPGGDAWSVRAGCEHTNDPRPHYGDAQGAFAVWVQLDQIDRR